MTFEQLTSVAPIGLGLIGLFTFALKFHEAFNKAETPEAKTKLWLMIFHVAWAALLAVAVGMMLTRNEGSVLVFWAAFGCMCVSFCVPGSSPSRMDIAVLAFAGFTITMCTSIACLMSALHQMSTLLDILRTLTEAFGK